MDKFDLNNFTIDKVVNFEFVPYEDNNKKPKVKYKQVFKEEFEKFIKDYPRKLEIDVCGIWMPPLVTFNDFELADAWPESVVAKTYMYSNDPKDYFYESEENRVYFILKEN